MASNNPPRFTSGTTWITLRASQTKSINIKNHVRGDATIVFFQGTPTLDWVTVKGNGVIEINPTNDLRTGYPVYQLKIEAISIFGIARRTYRILLKQGLRPRWASRWTSGGGRNREYVSENLMENWDLTDEVTGDGEITLSLRSAPSWVRLNGFILTYTPPNLTQGEYKDYNVKIRATNDYGTRDVTIILRVFNDGQTSLYFQLPSDREEIGEDQDFSFDASDYVQNNVGTVSYSKVRGSDWLDIDEDNGLVTGKAPLVDADERHSILIEVNDDQGFKRDTLLVTVLNEVVTPDPDIVIQWGTITVNPVDESKDFSSSVRSFLTGTTEATFSKVSGPSWMEITPAGLVRNVSGQTAPAVTADTDYTIGVRATVGTTNYDTTFTLTVRNVAGRNPGTNTPPVIANNIPDQYVDELNYFEFSVDSYVSGGESGGAIVISKITGPPWLSITGTGICSGTPKNVPSDTTYVVTFDAISVFGSATNGRFNLIVRNLSITRNPPVWQQDIDPFYANEFSRFNRNIRRFVSGSGLITLEKVSGPNWITISSDGQRLSGTTPRVTTEQQYAVTVRARSIYGTATKTFLFVVRDSLNPGTQLTFNPPDFTINENSSLNEDLSSYVTGATGTVRYQVNYPITGFRVSGSRLQYTAGNVDSTQYITVFVRAFDSLGGVTAVLTVIVRNTTGGGLPIVDEPTRSLPLSTASITTEQYSGQVDQVLYNVYAYRTANIDFSAIGADITGEQSEEHLDIPQDLFFGQLIEGGTWTKFPDDDIINYGTISSSLDTISVNEYKVNQATIILKNTDDQNEKYSPKNPNNFFYENYGDQYGYGMPVYIEAGYQTAEGIRSERIFEGVIINISQNVRQQQIKLQLSDDAQYLRDQQITDFGISKRLIADLETDTQSKQQFYSFYEGLTPISDGSINPIYPDRLNLVDDLKTHGRLSPLNINVTDKELRTEVSGPAGETRYQIELKTPYRYKKFETVIQDIAESAGIDVDRQKIILPNISFDNEIFSSLGRPGYETVHNYQQLRTRALQPFRWDGFVTDFHYDSREDHDKFYFLISAFSYLKGGSLPTKTNTDDDNDDVSSKESVEYLLRLDENFGQISDNYQRLYQNEIDFGLHTNAQSRFYPKIIQYDRQTDQWTEIVSRSNFAEWWKMTPNNDYTKWYVLGTTGEHSSRFLKPEFGGTFASSRPIPSTYDTSKTRSDEYGTFIEEVDLTTDPSSVVAFLDRSSDYPPQLAHFYQVGYGSSWIGPNNEIEIDNRTNVGDISYLEDGIKADSRRPIIWTNDRLYYGFARNNNTNRDFGVASTPNGSSITTVFNPIPMDKNNNWMGFTFDIKGNVLEFAFTAMTGTYPINPNTTFKVIRKSL